MATGTGIAALLQHSHDEVLDLADQLCREEDSPSQRRDIFHRFRQVWTPMARAEEAAVYEMLKTAKGEGAEALALQGYVEHSLFDHIIDKLGRSSAITSPSWTAHAVVLTSLLRRHVEDERGTLLSMLDRHFDAAQQAAMAAVFQAVRDELADQGQQVRRRA